MSQDLLRTLKIALQDFTRLPLEDAAVALWRSLGYESSRTLGIRSLDEIPDPDERLADLKKQTRRFRVLFQLTVDEIRLAGQPTLGIGRYDNQILESYLFTAVELSDQEYTRTQLADFTRSLNKVFPMPVMVLFKYGANLTIAAVQRRVNKRDESKDVIERDKVTLIRDIRYREPHRAHLEILSDLSLANLTAKKAITHFAELDREWRGQLDTKELNERFYKELANWFYWASEHKEVRFPDVQAETRPAEKKRKLQMQLIRLITRLIFVWFLKEKGLVPDDLFEPGKLERLLKAFRKDDPEDSTYYQAILQNLFFATLNQPMRRDDPEEPKVRRFVEDGSFLENRNEYGVNGYRYKSAFVNPDEALELFDTVPFLNGGLFECLDVYADKDLGIEERRVDGFSRAAKNRAHVPNQLFFAEKERVDLNSVYGTKGRRYEVRGLIELLGRYKFTVTENTPIEEEVALDPELLGKVFENLLASYNPETEETARKETGSFYTPRDIVDFMVDESLLVYLHGKLSEGQPAQVAGGGSQTPILYPQTPETLLLPSGNLGQDDYLKARLRRLLAFHNETPPFSDEEKRRIIEAIDECKIIDPACGSGAFPLGVLQKLVHILEQLDPGSVLWRAKQEENLRRDIENDPVLKALNLDLETISQIQVESLRTNAEREALAQIQERKRTLQEAFDLDLTYPDYARKLFLIENCIYGVDIQPIAVQIAKLRCFIALVVDQKHDDSRPNRGILVLPNLETKFVAANALFPLEQPGMKPAEIYEKEKELRKIRHEHFLARSFKKKKALRRRDAEVRREIAKILQDSGFASEEANRMAQFDPYNQNDWARFFDPNWMFSLERGFDLVIGNPPYIRQEKIKADKPLYQRVYPDVYAGTADIFVYFFRLGMKLLREGGVLCYICSNKYFRSGYGANLRLYLGKQTRIRLLVDFGDAPVFKAIAYPSILLTQKAKPNGEPMRVMSWNPEDDIEDFRDLFEGTRDRPRKSFEMPQSDLSADGWRIESSTVLKLLQKLREAGTPLGEYVNGRFYRGILTGFNEAFVINRAKRDELIAQDPKSAEVIKPFLRGRDVKRWKVDNPDLWLIFTRRGIDINKYPAIKKHLEHYKPQLMPGVPGGRKPGPYEWYEIQDNIAYWKEFEQPKIVYPDIYTRQSFTVDRDGYFCANTCYFIPTNETWLAGLLNSSAVEWFYRLTSNSVRGGYLRAFSDYMEQIPIPKATSETKLLLTRLVDYILFLSSQPLTAARDGLMVPFLEQIIDALVYELYLPEELHRAGRFPLQVLSAEYWPENPSLDELRRMFERLYDPNHPVRKLVYFLDSIEEVRLIQKGAWQSRASNPLPEALDADE